MPGCIEGNVGASQRAYKRRPSLARVTSRLFADPVQTHADWQRHRSSLRHVPEPGTLLRVLTGLAGPVFYTLLLSVLVGLYSQLLVPHTNAPVLGLQFGEFFAAITFAVSLLLVFKTNSSYARWWEGRCAWGQITSASQNLVRQAAAYFAPRDAPLLEALARWTAAQAWAAKAMVRAKSSLAAELEGLLLRDEAAWLLAQPNKPLAASQALSSVLAAASLPDMLRVHLDQQVALTVLYWGACARIFTCAIPKAYSRHTSRFLMVYITFVPLALWPTCGWATAVLAPLVAFLLVGTENIGAQLEEPFFVLPLDAICAAIQRDVLHIAAVTSAAHHGGGGGGDALSQQPPWAWLQKQQQQQQQQRRPWQGAHHECGDADDYSGGGSGGSAGAAGNGHKGACKLGAAAAVEAEAVVSPPPPPPPSAAHVHFADAA